MRELLTSGASIEELQSVIRANVWGKWIGHDIHQNTFASPGRGMYSIGG